MEKRILQSSIERGLSQRQIAQENGCSQSTVKHWLKKFGLSTRLSYKKKLCRYCGETDESMFMNAGNGRTSNVKCKSCHNQYTIERFRNNKLKAIEYKGGKCNTCGYDKCPGSLCFHHCDPECKDPNWKHMRNWKFERIKSELDKCDLLCANCHGEIHWGLGVIGNTSALQAEE